MRKEFRPDKEERNGVWITRIPVRQNETPQQRGKLMKLLALLKEDLKEKEEPESLFSILSRDDE